MQRIDENTYIDDTLVTCAEYQLFIDEMHTQGKYYQPDHWTSNRFPEGQAREPVLGVRHSDAVAFCKWMTKQEGGVWKYRLPIKEEANTYLPKSPEGNLLGFWLGEKNTQFAWIGPIPENPCAFDMEGIVTDALDRAHAIDRIRTGSRPNLISRILKRILSFSYVNQEIFEPLLTPTHDRILTLALGRALDLAIALDLDRTEALTRIFYLNFTFTRNYTNPIALALIRDQTLALAFVLAGKVNHTLPRNSDTDSSSNLAQDLERARNLKGASYLFRIRYLSLAITLVRNYDHKGSSNIARILLRSLNSTRAIARVHAYEYDHNLKFEPDPVSGPPIHDLDRSLSLYVDLFTLQERIAGRSPAFEGIRLVKERIR